MSRTKRTHVNKGRVQSRASRRSDWTVDEDLVLIRILKEMRLNGKDKNGHYSTENWNFIWIEYKKRRGDEMAQKEHLQCRLKVLKKNYKLIHNLRNKSGWTWDNKLCMIIAPDRCAWDELISLHKEYKKVKDKAFPQYDEMDFLCCKTIARCGNLMAITDGCGEGQGSATSEGEDAEHVEEVRVEDLTLDREVDDEVPIVQGLLVSDQGIHESQVSDQGLHESQVSDAVVGATLTPASWPAEPRTRSTGGGTTSGSKRRRSTVLKESTACRKMASHGELIEEQTTSYLTEREGLQNDVAWCTKKIKNVPGMTRRLLIAGVEAIKMEDNRTIVHILEGEDLLCWVNQQWINQVSALEPSLRHYMTDEPQTHIHPAQRIPTMTRGGRVDECRVQELEPDAMLQVGPSCMTVQK